jgi:uroporphyrinogen decarboxylase
MVLKERVITALQLAESDVVPIGELVIDNTVINGFKKGYSDVIDFAFGEGVGLVGTVAKFDIVNRLPNGSFIDEWGCTYGPSKDMVAHPISGPISSVEDLENHVFPDPESSSRLGNLVQLVEKADGKIAVNFHSRVAFMWSVFLMGMDNLLTAMLLEPDFVHCLFRRVADLNIRVIERAIEAGADTVSLGDDYCSSRGPLMSPAMFREFILPHLRRAVELVHQGGAFCIKHCDGNLWDLLDDFIDAGIDCINPIEPAANMDIWEVKKRYGDRVCIMGNIDCGDLLCNGRAEEVERAVADCIRKGAPGGGLIVSSSNSIHSGVKPENYAAMIRAVYRYGKYPISIK